MMVPFIIAAVVAVGFLGMWLAAQSKVGRLTGERDDLQLSLDRTSNELTTRDGELKEAKSQIATIEVKNTSLDSELTDTKSKLDESNDALRKRTELADAQALQIDALSGERDEIRQQLIEAEERIVTMAARPGVVVGDVNPDSDGTEAINAQILWDLEVARSERQWRNSVAIDPLGEPSPFEAADDPVREAVEIEAAALREDVGALIDVEWKAGPIEDPSRRLMIVRVAQEMLATAARVPGAARLLVTQDDESGELKLEFVSADDGNEVINLIPPQISSDLIDVRHDTGLSVTVKAE
jgi:hypothetical protein